MPTITRLTAEELPAHVPGLADLLIDATDDGASVGFLAPLAHEQAAAWWASFAPALADDGIVLWVAHEDGRVVGTIQLRLSEYPNGRHRGEIAKLLVHRDARGRGLARRLLAAAEESAAASGRTLLLLDTETGSTAENLYRTAGWTSFGTVPDHSADPSGILKPTTFFHKSLT
ncbi:GNAT family N-acetyltransferase [Streptomyces sannanensis]|uniref:GNAT family N-acetyltransferase n=1 Tax=Streptomyces sannanensis TaxID=285536 RepID=A0ABP6SDR2_9ACTN